MLKLKQLKIYQIDLTIKKLNNMNKKWNPSNWQGRSKTQIENGYKLTGIILTAFTIGMVIGIFYEIGKEYGIW